MEHSKKYPRYDDIAHIDTNAIARKAPTTGLHSPISDPDATAYTEMYCESTHSMEENSKPHFHR